MLILIQIGCGALSVNNCDGNHTESKWNQSDLVSLSSCDIIGNYAKRLHFLLQVGFYLFLLRKLQRNRGKKATPTPNHFSFVLDFLFQGYFLVNLIPVFLQF